MHKSDNEIQWKSIFETVQSLSEKREGNRKDALKKAIMEKEKTIKRLYLNHLGIPKYLSTEKPLSLKKMEKGLQNYYFGRKGQMTKRFAFIRKEVWKDERKKKENLEKKIDTGPLTYYFLKENEDTFEKRVNEVKKHKLKISLNYEVKDDKDLTLDQLKLIDQCTNNTNDSSGAYMLNYGKRRSIFNPIVSENLKKKRNLTPSHVEINNRRMSVIAATPKRSRNLCNIPPLLNTNSSIKPQNEVTKSLFNLRNKHQKTKTESGIIMPKSNYPLLSPPYKTFQTEPRKRQLKNTKALLLSKAVELGINQGQLEKQLFKLIDDANIEKKSFLNQAKDKDLEEILDLKVKKRNRKGEAKEMVTQAIKLKDDYTLMDRDKAEMLKLSDEITRMTDEAALIFAERIQDAYYKKSEKIEDNDYKVNPIREKQRKIKVFNMRNKINQGLIKMKKMSFNLDYEKSSFNKKYCK